MIEVKTGNLEGRRGGGGGGVNDFGIQRSWGVQHFGISDGKVGLKCPCCPWQNMDIFCHPLTDGSKLWPITADKL